jgi:two-component system nitrate/nitrite response regulator NarL
MQPVRTVVLEPNALARAGLNLLLQKRHYRILASSSNLQTVGDDLQDTPELVLIGGDDLGRAIAEAKRSREKWSDAKIILLSGAGPDFDYRTLMEAGADGCISTLLPGETITRWLDLIATETAKITVTVRCPETRTLSPHAAVPGPKPTNAPTDAPSSDPVEVDQVVEATSDMGRAPSPEGAPAENESALPREGPKLSDREAQVLDGIVKGLRNKVIARSCGITEATVKVHIKSILKKINAANRTQAAVWALESGHLQILHERVQARVAEIDAESPPEAAPWGDRRGPPD